MNLLITLALLVQDKAAEEAFKKIEETIEKAKTVSVKFRTIVQKGKDETGWCRGAIHVKEGNRLRIETRNFLPRPPSADETIVCDGKRIWSEGLSVGHGEPGVREQKAPEDLNGILSALARAGALFSPSSLGGGNPKEVFALTDLTMGPDDGGQKTVIYRFPAPSDVKPAKGAEIKLWFDPKTFTPTRRTMRIPGKPELEDTEITETYDEFVLNGVIPDETFTSPQRELSAPVPEKAAPPELKVLERWVGTWSEDSYNRKAHWTPADVQTPGIKTSWSWILGGRYLQEVLQNPDGTQSLCLWTYDSRRKEYRCWFFQPTGWVTEFTWDWEEKTQTFHGRLTHPDPAMAFLTKQRLIDKDHYEWMMTVRDAEGKLCLDLGGKSERKKIDPIDLKAGPADVGNAPGLKPLTRREGTWTVELLSRPAEWNPKEMRTTSIETSDWVLGGRILRAQQRNAAGELESFHLITQLPPDPQVGGPGRYRSWFFSSDGIIREAAVGEWTEATQTFGWTIPVDDRLTFQGHERFVDPRTHEGFLLCRDGSGKAYLDLNWTRKRRD